MHLGPNFATYFTQNTCPTPDIILSNNKATHNIITKPGPLTTSDHLLVLVTLTTEAVKENITSRPDYRKADWDKLNREIDEEMENTSIINRTYGQANNRQQARPMVENNRAMS